MSFTDDEPTDIFDRTDCDCQRQRPCGQQASRGCNCTSWAEGMWDFRRHAPPSHHASEAPKRARQRSPVVPRYMSWRERGAVMGAASVRYAAANQRAAPARWPLSRSWADPRRGPSPVAPARPAPRCVNQPVALLED